MRNNILRAIVEVGFIIFLFYSNLLMGEFVRGGRGQTMGFWWALRSIFTLPNFAIALIAGFIGYIVFEFLRERF